jgi:hypothetical protein
MQLIEDRQRERRRLAGAGLGETNQVAALLHDRQRLDLDRRRLGIALGFKRLEDRRRHAEILKCGHVKTLSRSRSAMRLISSGTKRRRRKAASC